MNSFPGNALSSELVGRRIRIPSQFTEPVTVEAMEQLDDMVLLRVRTASGELRETVLDTQELDAALVAMEDTATGPLLKDHEGQFLMVEAQRIRLAYAFDPFFAVSMSGIQPLPHQLEAVYRHMLPQPRLRFLLADDPGAGKTIMAGLLLKELVLRRAVERVLILAPAPLTLQWQDEMASKFDEVFERVHSAVARDQLAGSPWSRFPMCVASMDFAKQDSIKADLLQERWDLVIIDEAHKVSMPDRKHPTMRFRLAYELAERTERLLLLTATPHQGDPSQFQVLLSLLDEHAFRSDQQVDRLLGEPDNPWILRRAKEELRDFDGRKLFVPRHCYTEQFTLNQHEWQLYDEVGRYINRYFGRRHGRRRQTAALTRLVFQRRLASSLRAIRLSLERREARVSGLVEELRELPEAQRQARLLELAGVRVPDPEVSEDDLDHDSLDDEAAEMISAQRFEELERELEDLRPLVEMAQETEHRGSETKFDSLLACLERDVLAELHEEDGKLLVFTEQRSTLEMLQERLSARGFRCVVIHGGMDALARKEAQYRFQTEAQICIATDAAGEGINLQFCHLMINYDVPWNPNRLEQRMGRIHRFGQPKEVHVFNFVASSGPEGPDRQPVVEGQVMVTLLAKLNRIRDTLGDRVYDVVGMLLRLNKVNLEEVLRDATLGESDAWRDYIEDIDAIDEGRLTEFEEMTGIALAKHTVDLARVKGQDLDHEERRLMPEYVEEWFHRAADRTRLNLRPMANARLFAVPHVPERLRTSVVATASRRGRPERSYNKLTFWKDAIAGRDVNAELVSPIHPLYGAVEERLAHDLIGVRGGIAHWLDPFTKEPYRVHFFTHRLDGESLGRPSEPPRIVQAYGSLVAIKEDASGTMSHASADLLHDLSPATDANAPPPELTVLSPDDLKRVEVWLRAKIQHPRRKEVAEERVREVEIRRRFLEEAFEASIEHANAQMWQLQARVVDGDSDAAFALSRAERRVETIEEQRDLRLRALDHLSIVRPGPVTHLGTALVTPPGGGVAPAARDIDPEVERIAYDLVQQYEEAAGREVTRVYQLGDSCGFDLRSEGTNEVRRIEVKGHGGTAGGAFLTPNEWRKARRFRDTYWLYVVWGCTSGTPRLRAIRDPFDQLEAEEVAGIVHYAVTQKDVEQAEAEEWSG